jgi:hypothetical protein
MVGRARRTTAQDVGRWNRTEDREQEKENRKRESVMNRMASSLGWPASAAGRVKRNKTQWKRAMRCEPFPTSLQLHLPSPTPISHLPSPSPSPSLPQTHHSTIVVCHPLPPSSCASSLIELSFVGSRPHTHALTPIRRFGCSIATGLAVTEPRQLVASTSTFLPPPAIRRHCPCLCALRPREPKVNVPHQSARYGKQSHNSPQLVAAL